MGYWIVVVDDEALSLTNVKNMLSDEDLRVSCLRSGKDLLRFMEKNEPDLILLDILMADLNGFETFRALRQREEEAGRPPVPVIFLTGERDDEVEQKGLAIGAADFIRKPFNKEVLLRRIENTITNSRTIVSLTEEAAVDRMTGFLNKAHGTKKIAELCRSTEGALVIMDLDSFKLVNDLFGHDMGDKMLEAFAQILRNNMKEGDVPARIGGDEFLLFCEGLVEEKALAELVGRLNEAVRSETARLLGEDHGLPIGVSAGAVMVPRQGTEMEELFTLADSALYGVKQNGKHGYAVYSPVSETAEPEEDDADRKLERTMRIMEERSDQGGAMTLGNDSFGPVYRFIRRYYKRFGGDVILMMFTLKLQEGENDGMLAEKCAQFEDVLRKALRMSDIVIRNGVDSIFALLTERSGADAEGAAERIMEVWKRSGYSEGVTVEHVFRYLEKAGE
ncbi:MAG: diguanylate cyclase [Lachnospiraceae bacterium]|nr:diguanylate cyclase [Lachnospiraceae bacterium]